MEPKDWISVVALLVSLATAYYGFLRPPKIVREFGDVLLIRMPPEGTPIIMPELALYNSGARVGIVKKIRASIRSMSDNRLMELNWASNVVSEYKAPQSPNEPSGSFTRFDNFPHTIFVSKDEAVIKRLSLVASHAYELVPGDYELELRVATSRVLQSFVMRAGIRLRAQDASFFAANRQTFQGRNLRLNFDPELQVFLSVLAVPGATPGTNP
jgi:hypothetical protein